MVFWKTCPLQMKALFCAAPIGPWLVALAFSTIDPQGKLHFWCGEGPVIVLVGYVVFGMAILVAMQRPDPAWVHALLVHRARRSRFPDLVFTGPARFGHRGVCVRRRCWPKTRPSRLIRRQTGPRAWFLIHASDVLTYLCQDVVMPTESMHARMNARAAHLRP